MWWCPGAGVDAHLSAYSSRQAEAAPALAATVQGVPPAPGVWIAHAAEAADATEVDPRPQILPVQSPVRSVPAEAVVAEYPRALRRTRRRKRQKASASSESSSVCSGSGLSASEGPEEAPGFKPGAGNRCAAKAVRLRPPSMWKPTVRKGSWRGDRRRNGPPRLTRSATLASGASSVRGGHRPGCNGARAGPPRGRPAHGASSVLQWLLAWTTARSASAPAAQPTGSWS